MDFPALQHKKTKRGGEEDQGRERREGGGEKKGRTEGRGEGGEKRKEEGGKKKKREGTASTAIKKPGEPQEPENRTKRRKDNTTPTRNSHERKKIKGRKGDTKKGRGKEGAQGKQGGGGREKREERARREREDTGGAAFQDPGLRTLRPAGKNSGWVGGREERTGEKRERFMGEERRGGGRHPPFGVHLRHLSGWGVYLWCGGCACPLRICDCGALVG